MSDFLIKLSHFVDSLISILHKVSITQLNIPIILIFALLLILSYLSHNNIILRINLYLSFIPTLIHEFGHAIIAQITGSKVTNIKMMLSLHEKNKTGSLGYAEINFRNWFSRVLSAFSGYIFPPLIFLLGIWSLSNGYAILFVLIIIIALLDWLIYTSQKWIPLILIIIMVSLNIYPDLTQLPIALILNGILGLLLGESIRSIFVTMQVNFSKQEGWDGIAMRSLTLIPSTIWFFIWSIITLSCLYFSFIIAIK